MGLGNAGPVTNGSFNDHPPGFGNIGLRTTLNRFEVLGQGMHDDDETFKDDAILEVGCEQQPELESILVPESPLLPLSRPIGDLGRNPHRRVPRIEEVREILTIHQCLNSYGEGRPIRITDKGPDPGLDQSCRDPLNRYMVVPVSKDLGMTTALSENAQGKMFVEVYNEMDKILVEKENARNDEQNGEAQEKGESSSQRGALVSHDDKTTDLEC
ncbi:hypothetical protein FRX31_030402 [Thalictrum thalictroides]|uniref:Uncharacterized protein n=1 Tax=Thalictrum thalictroides TaxID=46969 RepID=A0A7J6V5M2_THATH|nr:hypothetical protein FRX31_030402 [Thalictrum thalictroides]